METESSINNTTTENIKIECEIKETELSDNQLSPPTKKYKIDDEISEIKPTIENIKIECEIKETELSDDQPSPPTKKQKIDDEITEIKPEQTTITENPPMSKRQKKKLLRGAQWEIKKKIKRLEEREKYKQKRQIALAKGEPTRIGPSRKELKKKQLEFDKIDNKNNLKIAVDLDFDDLMTDRDITKCVKQLLRIYTINRRSQLPGNLYYVGVKENGNIHKCLEKNDGYENWHVKWEFNKNYSDVFNHNEIIYLSSDSDNVLEKFDPNCIYVIGGIVDHNHHKGLCFERAQKLNIKTARLPLNEHVHIKTRTVLSTVHVFEMLLSVSEGKSWTETILKILPMRKGAKPLEDIKVEEIEDVSDDSDDNILIINEDEIKNNENLTS